MPNLVVPEIPSVMRAAGTAGATPIARLPLPWLLFTLAFAAWFPWTPYWQSDDFIALHYATSLERALADFSGNQYGLDGVVAFFRPLITLSFWAEQALAGGANPLVSHLSNVLAHATSAVVVGMLGARFLGGARGFCAGLVWALQPAHVGAIAWTVGRVDSHTMVWSTLACLGFVRFVDGHHRTRLPALAALALALCSKESALVVPGLCAWLGACAARPGARLRGLFAAWPTALLVAAYLGWRTWQLGAPLGGYEAASLDPLAAVRGLGWFVLRLANPLLDRPAAFADLPSGIEYAGFAPLALAIVIAVLRGRARVLAAAIPGFALAALPAAQFFAQAGDVASLRYFYMATVALAFVVAAGGIAPALLALVVAALPTFEARRAWIDAQADAGTYHRQLLADATELPPGRVFVAGLPRQSGRTAVVQFHLGFDRLLRPPFTTDATRTTYALRPLGTQGDVLRIPYGDEVGLPFDTPTLRFENPTIRGRLPRASVAECTLELVGAEAIRTADLLTLNDGSKPVAITVRGARAAAYRVTLFTAGGYVTATVADRAAAGATDGAIDVKELLAARYVANTTADQAHVVFALGIATTLDLEPTFPVLVEALDGERVTHANRLPLELRFDRELYAFLHPR